jgi:alcohol dehydrogenase class IV
LERLEAALKKDHIEAVGVRKGMTPHSLFSELLATAAEIEKLGADCIITVGGGSLVDSAKFIPFVSSVATIYILQNPDRS